jgi:hypothetical protein
MKEIRPVLEEPRMSFRVSALVATVAVFGLAELTPAFAQPQAPIRPRYGAFGNIFSPSRLPFGGAAGAGFGQNQPFVNPLGPQVAGVGAPQGFVFPGQTAFPQALPGAYGTIDPLLPPTGTVGTFNNLGHWYPPNGIGGGNYGHWYPNGIANGRGITGYGGGGGGAYAGTPVIVGGARTGGGSLVGTAVTAGAAMNQIRR